MKIKFDEKKAKEVFAILDEKWQNLRGIFENVILPQDQQVIEYNESKELANFLFYGSLFMRGGVNSDDAFKWVFRLKEKFPKMFIPELVCFISSNEIEEVFLEVTKSILNGKSSGKIGAGALSYKIKENSQNWHKNSLVLVKKWNGDIRNVYKGCSGGYRDFETAFLRIDSNKHVGLGFNGMRRKIFSLLTIMLQDAELIPLFPTPIPVDFHVFRVLLNTNIISGEILKPLAQNKRYPTQLIGKPAIRVSEKLVDTVHKWSQKFISKNSFSHLYINPALWVLSRSLCSKHKQATSEKNRTVFMENEKLVKNPELWGGRYRNPCGCCPIENYCDGIVPSAPYYKWGLLVRFDRVPYHTSNLPGIFWSDFSFNAYKRR